MGTFKFDPPSVILPPAPEIITDPLKLRITVDPTPEELATFSRSSTWPEAANVTIVLYHEPEHMLGLDDTMLVVSSSFDFASDVCLKQNQLQKVGERPIGSGSVVMHTVYMAEIDEAQMDWLIERSAKETKEVRPEIHTLWELRTHPTLDWFSLGMILSAIYALSDAEGTC